jgi:hypothetical protein
MGICADPPLTVASHSCVRSVKPKQKEERGMNYMDFAPYVIGERNQQVQREMHALHLEERLPEGRGSSGSRFVALARTGVRPLLRGVAMVT